MTASHHTKIQSTEFIGQFELQIDKESEISSDLQADLHPVQDAVYSMEEHMNSAKRLLMALCEFSERKTESEFSTLIEVLSSELDRLYCSWSNFIAVESEYNLHYSSDGRIKGLENLVTNMRTYGRLLLSLDWSHSCADALGAENILFDMIERLECCISELCGSVRDLKAQ